MLVGEYGQDIGPIGKCVDTSLPGEICHAGVEAEAYHAGLKDAVRGKVLKDWSAGIVPVVVATIAFGMGIDRASRSHPQPAVPYLPFHCLPLLAMQLCPYLCLKCTPCGTSQLTVILLESLLCELAHKL